jgi:3-keto-L-gulonate-6-phosphate decarboxylase
MTERVGRTGAHAQSLRKAALWVSPRLAIGLRPQRKRAATSRCLSLCQGGSGSAAGAARSVERLRSPNGHDHDTLKVDGGIDARTAPQCAARGARMFVAGNAIFGTTDPGAAYAEIAA